MNPHDLLAQHIDCEWLPCGWRSGDDDPYAPDEGHTIANVHETLADFAKRKQPEKDENGKTVVRGYYTKDNRLTDWGADQKDSQTAEDVAHNVALLRDTWNTPAFVWQLLSALAGVDFKVDPFWNPATAGLPHLVNVLDGNDGRDGFLVREQSRFPLLWRGDLPKGQAPAAVNGPHSCTERWLSSTVAYGREEIAAAIIPDRGNAYVPRLLESAAVVCRLGRVAFDNAFGIGKSTPQGPTLAVLYVPEYLRPSLPEHTRRVIAGATIKVPLRTVKAKGEERIHYAEIGPSPGEIVDLLGVLPKDAKP